MNFTTFDIIGDLAFSEPFRSLENSLYHPWVRSIFKGIQGVALRRFLVFYPTLSWVIETFDLSSKVRQIRKIRSSARDMAWARLQKGPEPVTDHRDFVSYMLKRTRDGADGMSESEVLANAALLVLAGSETTAMALSGFFFYLSQNPHVHALLVDEIRSAFDGPEDITLRSTASLEYLQACINEILRIYPPATEITPRISPGDFIDGKYVPAGVSASTCGV